MSMVDSCSIILTLEAESSDSLFASLLFAGSNISTTSLTEVPSCFVCQFLIWSNVFPYMDVTMNTIGMSSLLASHVNGFMLN